MRGDRHHQQGHHHSPRQDMPGDGPSVVVAAVDYSEVGLRAVDYAAGLARRSHAQLVLVHVCPAPPTAVAFEPFSGFLVGDQPEGVDALALDGLRRLTSNRYGVDPRVELLNGSPPVEIARLADALHADVVVVGAPQSFPRRLSRSLPRKLIRRRRWPVLVIP